jgi:hypothetical protein
LAKITVDVWASNPFAAYNNSAFPTRTVEPSAASRRFTRVSIEWPMMAASLLDAFAMAGAGTSEGDVAG